MSYLYASKLDVDGRDEPGHDGDRKTQAFSSPSPVRRVEREVLRDRTLPTIAVRKQTLLVVIQLLARLGREFEIRAFDYGVDRTCLLAETAVNALHHVDVITRRPARAVIASGT